MKEIKKETIKKLTLTKEEMCDIVGGTRVNGFIGSKLSKGIFYWTRKIWK